jgi:hypothetical protein
MADFESPKKLTVAEQAEKARETWVVAPTDYPPLTLASTLTEILAFAFDRSEALEDGMAVVQFADPATVVINWPTTIDPDKSHSQIYVRLQARPTGGARIGIWHSEPRNEPNEPEAPPPEEPAAEPEQQPATVS